MSRYCIVLCFLIFTFDASAKSYSSNDKIIVSLYTLIGFSSMFSVIHSLNKVLKADCVSDSSGDCSEALAKNDQRRYHVGIMLSNTVVFTLSFCLVGLRLL